MQKHSTSAHDFSKAPQATIPRSSFNRSHGIKTTFDAGYLVPLYVDEVLPGDTHKLSATLFARFATLLYPMMENVYLDTHFFFCPARLVQTNFVRLMGEHSPDPDSSIDYEVPTVTSTNTTDFDQGTIYDYFGIPTKLNDVEVNSLPLRCFNLIYQEWFRDENLQDGVVLNVDDGPDAVSDYTLLRRGKRFDYFTSCLPWPQKGTAVSLPLGTSAPILYQLNPGNGPYIRNNSTGALLPGAPTAMESAASTAIFQMSGGTSAIYDPNGTLYADLSDATAATINDLRNSLSIQRLLERDARGGSRYTELLKAHFGVSSPDSRLQRPELLSVGSTPLNVSAVAQTSESNTTKQGTLAAYATATAHNHGFVKSFVEHGYIIGIVSARADLTYQQGLNKLWNRRSRYDFYWPEFSNLGEQAVLMKELYTTGVDVDDDAVFGYQEAWADLRYKNSTITGLFRSNATGTLDAWHLSQELSTPTLNASFIVENPPTTRVKATSGDPDFILDGHINLVSARPMPTYSIPGITARF